MSGKGSVRIKGDDFDRLSKIRNMRAVREMAVEQGVADDASRALSFEELFLLIIPEDADPIERPEDEMSWQGAGEAKPRIQELAGENVPIHEVVTKFTEEFIEQHDIEIYE